MVKKTTKMSPVKPRKQREIFIVPGKGECSKTAAMAGQMIPKAVPADPNFDVQPVRHAAYCNSKRLHELVEKLNQKQKSDVESIGFGGLLEIKLASFFQGMVPFLLGAYNGYGRRFKVAENRECYLKPCDVYDVFMLPCETGKHVEETCHKRSDNPDSRLEQAWKDKFGVQHGKELPATVLAAEMLKLADRQTKDSDIVNNNDDIVDQSDVEPSQLSQFWSQQLKKPEVIEELDGWVRRVMEAAEHARMMPSFDLGIDDIVVNNVSNMERDIPRYNTRHQGAGTSKKIDLSKKRKQWVY